MPDVLVPSTRPTRRAPCRARAAATLASFALLGVLNWLSRHVDTVAAALGSDDPLASSVRKGPFGTALRRYVESVRNAETEIAILRGKLAQGEKR